MYYLKFLVLSLFIFLTACFKPNIYDFKNVEPKFDLIKVFNGKFKGNGVVFDRKGLIIDTFTIELEVSSQDSNTLMIQEKAVFKNKEEKQRKWIYRLKNNNEIEAGTDDKIGLNYGNDIVDIARGSVAGNARYLNYVFRAKISDKTPNVEPLVAKNDAKVDSNNDKVSTDKVDAQSDKDKSNAENAKNVSYQNKEIKTIDLDVRDFLYMIDENNLINRLYYFKFGMYAGEAVIFYTKVK